MSKKHSPIDDLFNSLYGFYPAKAGTAYEMLVDAAYAITHGGDMKHDQKIKSQYCDTDYQIDGLATSENGSQRMIEAKDYTIRNESVGRGDLQKLQGALTDLNVEGGVFASATDYTKDAKEYAEGSHINPRQVPIELYHIRPSVAEDEDGRIKEILCTINARSLNFTPSCISPIFSEASKDVFDEENLLGKPIRLTLDRIYDSNGSTKFTIMEYSLKLNKLVDIEDHTQTRITGVEQMDNVFIKLETGRLCPISGLEYDIDIEDISYSFAINQEGNPVILVKSHDGSIDTLLTDEQLKKCHFDKNGHMNML